MNATAVLPAPHLTGDDTDLCHLTCYDDNIAMCGLDVTGHDWIGDNVDLPPCLLCDYIDRENLPCPIAGCQPEGQL
jgi:hypothetical protein